MKKRNKKRKRTPLNPPKKLSKLKKRKKLMMNKMKQIRRMRIIKKLDQNGLTADAVLELQ